MQTYYEKDYNASTQAAPPHVVASVMSFLQNSGVHPDDPAYIISDAIVEEFGHDNDDLALKYMEHNYNNVRKARA